jgi:peptidyl-prolyl cis-trans isomerase A (cyclophilin A)
MILTLASIALAARLEPDFQISLGDGVPPLCLSSVPSAGKPAKPVRVAITAVREALTTGSLEGADAALATAPAHPAVDVHRAAVLAIRAIIGEAEPGPAAAVWRELRAAHPEDVCVARTAAVVGIIGDDAALSTEAVDAIVARAPTDPRAALTAGMVLMNLDPPRAAKVLDQASAANPKEAELAAFAGVALLESGGDVARAIDRLGVAERAGLPVGSYLREALLRTHNLANYLAHVSLPGPLGALATAPDPAAAYAAWIGVDTGKKPWVTIDTSVGPLECELFPDRAPATVASFVGLARGTLPWTAPGAAAPHTAPLFPGTVFHRVIPGFMVQGGDPVGTGSGGPGYELPNETWPDLTFDRPGRLAMANAGPDTNGSQFFITEQATPHLNGNYTIFGQCSDATVAVVKQMAALPRNEQDRPDTPPVIQAIRIDGR